MAYVFRIRGSVKNYEWGKHGIKSMVAILYSCAHKDFIVEENKPYAELWLGTHSSGPSSIPHLNDVKLLDWLLEKKFDFKAKSSEGLPFLFKVLSVNKALSIQAHPDKETAPNLHKEFPHYYPDDNHKPELAIALTNFEALCGFRPVSELKCFLTEIVELQSVIGMENTSAFLDSGNESNLRALFSAVMTSSPDTFKPLLLRIVDNFNKNKYKADLVNSIKQIFLKTYEQYPGDIGCLCFFFLNYINLKPGEALFLAANEPHAYLYGDCVECMACSDNVVRAGLTPKYRDIETLCNMLTYNCKPKEENLFSPTNDPLDPYVKIYAPPVKEFAVDSISLSENTDIYNLKVIDNPSILLVIRGKGKWQFEEKEQEFDSGTSLFISGGTSIKLKPDSDSLMFRAYY